MTAAIQFDSVSKYFNLELDRPRSFQERFIGLLRRRPNSHEKFWALRDASFDIRAGETAGLIGENGAGKSTALRLMARTLLPSSGRVLINGSVAALLELGAGFHPDLTGRENVYLNGSIMGLSRAQIRRKLDDIIAFAELERFIDVPVKHYSSGMYVRLGFSVAVHTDPEILLVDEVLAVGDQNFQHKCLERILSLQQRGVSICLVSHDLESIRKLCSVGVWLQDGQVRAMGNVQDTVSAYLRYAAEEEEAKLRAAQPQSPAADKSPARECGQGKTQTRKWGTGDVEITSVTFLDAEGHEQQVFHVGEPWIARIHYCARQRVERPTFGLAVHRNDGVHVCGPNTHFGGMDIPAVEGEGDVFYRIEHLPLMEGTYLLSAAAHNEADTVLFDYHDRLYTFKVRQVGHGERYGLVSLGGTWQWQDGARRVE